jgi:dihydroorotate dehydrogenase (NAD+) catalytic subunit
MAGASLAGIGTAVRYRGIDVFQKITDEIQAWLSERHLTMDEIIGAAHKEQKS